MGYVQGTKAVALINLLRSGDFGDNSKLHTGTVVSKHLSKKPDDDD